MPKDFNGLCHEMWFQLYMFNRLLYEDNLLFSGMRGPWIIKYTSFFYSRRDGDDGRRKMMSEDGIKKRGCQFSM